MYHSKYQCASFFANIKTSTHCSVTVAVTINVNYCSRSVNDSLTLSQFRSAYYYRTRLIKIQFSSYSIISCVQISDIIAKTGHDIKPYISLTDQPRYK